MKIEIVTPSGLIYDVKCLSVKVPAFLGELEILPKHSSMVVLVKVGCLSVEVLGLKKKVHFAVTSGFAFVENDNVSVLCDEVIFVKQIKLNEERLRVKSLGEKIGQLRNKIMNDKCDYNIKMYKEALKVSKLKINLVQKYKI